MLSENLNLDSLTVSDCASLTHVARGLRARYVTIERCEALTHLAEDFKYCHNLYLRQCPSLNRLPHGFTCGTQMVFESCPALVQLPDDIGFAGITQFENCPSLTRLPERPKIVSGGLSFYKCDALQRLPENMTLLSLNIVRCRSLEELPRGLKITGHTLRVSDCNLTHLPEDLEPTSEIELNNLPLLKDIPSTLIEWLEASGKKYVFKLEDTGLGAEAQQRLHGAVPLREPLPNVRFIFARTKAPSAPAGDPRPAPARPQPSERRRRAAKVDLDVAAFEKAFDDFSARHALANRSAFNHAEGPWAEAAEQAALLEAAGRELEESMRHLEELKKSTAAMIDGHAAEPRKPDYYIEDLSKEREMLRAMR